MREGGRGVGGGGGGGRLPLAVLGDGGHREVLHRIHVRLTNRQSELGLRLS